MGDHGKIHSKHKLQSKSQFFATGCQSYEIKSFIFQLLADAGITVLIFMVEPCEIAKLQILVTPARTLFKICLKNFMNVIKIKQIFADNKETVHY